MNRSVGYCTNVHAGVDLNAICLSLAQHSRAVRERLGLDRLPVGLWLPNSVAEELTDDACLDVLVSTLEEHRLEPYTLNGFPYGDFHQEVVKHAVYKPAWWERSRADYTIRLARLLARLLEPGGRGTISTLPLGWPTDCARDTERERAAELLIEVNSYLSRIAETTGCTIGLAMEPEPGCLLQTSADVVDFFERFLRPAARRIGDGALQHVGVCHDVCHAVVMREDQAAVIERYVEAGITVSKVQISSCVVVDFDAFPETDRGMALEELASFAEDRYLHQTTIATPNGVQFFEDLPNAILMAKRAAHLTGEWRTHFHVPVHLDCFGLLSTSRHEIENCMKALAAHSLQPDLEVETYAWGVLPQSLQTTTLSEGIARELQWFASLRH